jgi:two-component system response regulator PilR (NtrC family)
MSLDAGGATMPERRILLVEDDPDVAALLEHVLIDEGYPVDVARTLEQARSCLDERTYALLITDLRMPDGDGMALADHAAELGIRTAVMSGYVHRLAPETADRHEVMAKPLRRVELITIVRRLIG